MADKVPPAIPGDSFRLSRPGVRGMLALHMDTRRRWYIATGLVIVALILATDPFTLLNAAFRRPIPVPPASAIDGAANVVAETGKPGAEYLVSGFEDAPVLFLGEFPQIADHPRFLADSLPALAEAGIRRVALEQLRSADQREIDALLLPGSAAEGGSGAPAGESDSPRFDTEGAERLLFRRDVTWGFREYRDILEAAWSYNREHPEAPIRILGLSVGREPGESAEAHELRLEAHMAGVLAEFLGDRDTAARLLVYVSARRAIPGVPDLAFRQAAEAGMPEGVAWPRDRSGGSGEPRRLGVWAREELPLATRSVLLHAPWPAADARYGMEYPATALIDHAVFSTTKGVNPELPWGFHVRDSVLDGTMVNPLGLRPETESASFSDLTDGYLVVSKLGELEAATPIPDFVPADAEAQALERYPGDLPDSATADDMNNYIARTSENLGKILESFRDVD